MNSPASNAQTKIEIIGGINTAYRQFGTGEPLLMVNRFRGVMDTWDPIFLDALAAKHKIILFDYPGIGASEGQLPSDINEVAAHIIHLADHLGLDQFNILGWSYGGLVTQTVTFLNPKRIKRTVLIGTNPPGNNAIPIEPAFFERALKPENDLEDEYVLFFEPTSEKSRAAAKVSHDRIAMRLDRNMIPATQELFQRYFAGSAVFREDKLNFREQYKNLQSPVLIISGDHDISFATENWFPLLRNAPTMQHIILNDAGHGPQHQHPELAAGYINFFLSHS